MGKYLGYFQADLKKLQAEYTAKEIDPQPELWLETLKIIETDKTKIQAFLEQIDFKNRKIILTVACSSEFIGNCAEPLLKRDELNVQSIATTDIVTNPREYLNPDEKTVLISFARSGNSPESVASVKLANEIVKDIYHILLLAIAKDN